MAMFDDAMMYEDNIAWDDQRVHDLLSDMELWEPDEDEDPRAAGGCHYCDATEVREHPDPFGGKPCCEECFDMLIGGDDD